MKVRSSIAWMAFGIVVFSCSMAKASPPSDKRTILTSGEKVYTIRYKLGQSTILYFGVKPEIVICGNKNYFNIEKIKDAIAVQPLSNFSTNLTVISGNRRYLFYLTPSGSSKPDGFVELKWIPVSEAKPVAPFAKVALETVREIKQKMTLGQFEITVLREKVLDAGRRKIFEFEMRTSNRKAVKTSSFEILASQDGKPLGRQIAVWDSDEVSNGRPAMGRLIISGANNKSLSLLIGYEGRSAKTILKGSKN